jgi:hypothetical protein
MLNDARYSAFGSAADAIGVKRAGLVSTAKRVAGLGAAE